MKKSMLLLTSVIVMSCGSVKLMAPTQADVERGSSKYPGLTLEALNAGKINYEKHCSTCHGLKKPRTRTEDQWKSIVPKMAARAQKKAGNEVIDAAAQESILLYLGTMSKPG